MLRATIFNGGQLVCSFTLSGKKLRDQRGDLGWIDWEFEPHSAKLGRPVKFKKDPEQWLIAFASAYPPGAAVHVQIERKRGSRWTPLEAHELGPRERTPEQLRRRRRARWAALRALVLIAALLAAAYVRGIGPFAERIPVPDQSVVRWPVLAKAKKSAFMVFNSSCRKAGSGWVIARNRVMTNAHVVSGTDAPLVIIGPDRALRARVEAIDPKLDLALLRVRGLEQKRSLALDGRPLENANGVLLGVLDANKPKPIAVRIGRTKKALSRDYTGKKVLREITEVRGDLRHGQSGAAIVNEQGEVMAVLYGLDQTNSSGQYGFATPVAAVKRMLMRAHTSAPPLLPGECAG